MNAYLCNVLSNASSIKWYELPLYFPRDQIKYRPSFLCWFHTCQKTEVKCVFSCSFQCGFMNLNTPCTLPHHQCILEIYGLGFS